jgi:hypothetical protein
VLLVGIVAMQVEILKLGTGMGRWIDRSSTLQTRNQALQVSVAGLTDDQRIESLAAKMGMVMPDPTAVSFLSAKAGGDTARAIANIHAPDSSVFSSQATGQSALTTSTSAIPIDQSQSASASAQPVDSSSGSSPSSSSGASSSSSAASGTSASSQPQDTGAASGAVGTGQPAGTGTTSSSSGSSQPAGSGSGGAASIAPSAGSQANGSTGG